MYQIILLIHVFAAILIVALVLVQQGKGATMGAAFGSGASQTIFGSRGSNSFLFRITIGLILVFFVTSISLNYLTSHAMRQERVMTLPTLPPAPDAGLSKPTTRNSTMNTGAAEKTGPGSIPIRK